MEREEKIFTLYANDLEKLDEAEKQIKQAVKIGDKKPEKIPSIIEKI